MNQEAQPTKEQLKSCPFCAEEIQLEAIRCKHCGEYLDGRQTSPKPTSALEDDRFDTYLRFLMEDAPSFRVASKNFQESSLILNREQSNFSCAVCFVLLLLGVVPGLIYAIVAGNAKSTYSVVVYFDQAGNPTSINRSNASWLISGFDKWKKRYGK